MSKLTQDDIDRAEELKQQIEDSLEELKEIAKSSENVFYARFESYVVGPIEHAIDDFTGMSNGSITEMIGELKEDLEMQQEELLELAKSLGQDDAMDDEDHLRERLAYWINGEYNEDEADQKQAQIDGINKLIKACD